MACTNKRLQNFVSILRQSEIAATSNVASALFLTTWHMVFAACMTQVLARTTPYLDSRHKVPMTPQKYMYVQLQQLVIASID